MTPGYKLLALLHVAGAVRTLVEVQDRGEATYTPVASDECLSQKHFLGIESGYFAALNEDDLVVNQLFEVDISWFARPSEDWAGNEYFREWHERVEEELGRLALYPAFRSTVAKAGWSMPYLWCPIEIDLSRHLYLETLQADDPHKDVLSRLAQANYGPYFPKDAPRWRATVFRYATGDGGNEKTKAVFIALRTGHMVADGASLVSMMVTSVVTATWRKEEIPQSISEAASPVKPVVADIPAEAKSKRPVQIGRFDISLARLTRLRKKLSESWSTNQTTTKVTLTTLVQTAVLRVVSSMKGKSGLQLAMPRDARGTELNRQRSVPAFKKVAAKFAEDLLNWGPTNLATGAAHVVKSGCDAKTKTLDAWKLCYMKMQAALGERYMGGAQDFIESAFSVRARAKLYPVASKAQSWMLSSMNAGPQQSALAGAYIDSMTVFLKPTNLFKRTVMLMAAGDKLSFGIMAPEGSELTQRLQQEMEELLEIFTWEIAESLGTP